MERNLAPSTLDRRRQVFCQALAIGASQRAAARRAGIHEVTASRWVRDPVIQERVHDLQAEAIDEARRKLQGQVKAAIAAIREALTTREYDRSMATRLRAAWKVLKVLGLDEPPAAGSGPLVILTRVPRAEDPPQASDGRDTADAAIEERADPPAAVA